MRPFEADEYAAGWAARIAEQLRSDNPWKYSGGAWDNYRQRAWDSGWCRCDRGEKWVDPRRKRGAA